MTVPSDDLQTARRLIERLMREHRELLQRHQPVMAMNLPRGHVLTAAEKFLWSTETTDEPMRHVLYGFAEDVAAAVAALVPCLSELEQEALDARLSGRPAESHAVERALRKVRLLAHEVAA